MIKTKINIDNLFVCDNILPYLNMECNDGGFIFSNALDNNGLMIKINDTDNGNTICLLASSVFINPDKIKVIEDKCETVMNYENKNCIVEVECGINNELYTELIVNEKKLKGDE